MPWIIGIDEAGYGPNLGPLVMTSVACYVPEQLSAADLWKVLKKAVRRHPSEEDGRLLIEDSKLVYSTARGLGALETGVLATLSHYRDGSSTLHHYLERICPTYRDDLAAEPWYFGTTALPIVVNAADLNALSVRFEHCCKKGGVAWGLVRSVIVCPTRFNRLLDHWGSKGAVLGEGLAELLQCNCGLPDDSEPLLFLIDKHGGRNNYAAMLQHALPEGLVLARQESMARSVYRVLGMGREIRLTIQPRADGEYFCVALASMVSKYVRELLMLEFNRFWQAHVPGLKPTAGYPGDAERFFKEIRPAMERRGIVETVVWRRK